MGILDGLNVTENIQKALAKIGNPDAWIVTNEYGAAAPEGTTYKQGYHTGIDYSLLNAGNLVTNLLPGKVQKIGNDPDGWGNYVVVEDNAGNYGIYAHLEDNSIGVTEGQLLPSDSSVILGKAGQTGQATGTHLHFEVRSDLADGATALDPTAYLSDYSKLSLSEQSKQAYNQYLTKNINTENSITQKITDWFGVQSDNMKILGLRSILIIIGVFVIFMIIRALILGR